MATNTANYNNYNAVFNSEKLIMATLEEDGNITTMDNMRNKKQIGVQLQVYQNLVQESQEKDEIIEKYYNKLVELGAIVPQLTPEELQQQALQKQLKLAEETAKKQAEMLVQNQELIMAMMSKIEKLDNKLGGVQNESVDKNGGANGSKKNGKNDSGSKPDVK